MRARWSSLAMTMSTPSSTPLRPSLYCSNARVVYCSIASGCVDGTISTCSWLPLRCCRASACCTSPCFCVGDSVPVVSTTGESSGGIAASCCAWAIPPASSMAPNTTPRSQWRSAIKSRSPAYRRGLRLRRGRWRGLRRRRGVEVDVRRLLDLLLVLDGEVGLGSVVEHHRRQVHRELADVGVVVLHGLDVAAACDGDAVLRAFKLRLQVAEGLVRLEVGIVLGDDEQAAQRARQLALRLLELGKRRRVIRVDVDLADLCPRLRHFGQHALLMRRVALDRVDQVRDQVNT